MITGNVYYNFYNKGFNHGFEVFNVCFQFPHHHHTYFILSIYISFGLAAEIDNGDQNTVKSELVT